MTIGGRALDWMLRRLEQGGAVEGDLVLVADHRALAAVPDGIDRGARSWRVVRVTGELTLRDALPEEGALIAVVPPGFIPPLDIASRAYLGRILQLRAEDLVAGFAGRFCEPFLDDELAKAVLDGFERLGPRLEGASLGNVVTASDVRRMVVAVELGIDRRLGLLRADELLAGWIERGAPSPASPRLVARALDDALGHRGRWLAWAVTEGTVDDLVAAGALAGSERGRARAPKLPEVASTADWRRLRRLVERAVREALDRAPGCAEAALESAEALYHCARISAQDAGEHPLLRAAFDQVMHAQVSAAAEGAAAPAGALDAIAANIHMADGADALALTRDLARLSRFVGQDGAPAAGAPLDGWIAFAGRDVCWADLALRRLRRGLGAGTPEIVGVARDVIARTLAHRDGLNRGFATCLAGEWRRAAGVRDLKGPIALQQLSRCLIRRLVGDGQKVLLLVLDGCDLSTFLELVRPLPGREGIGLVLPKIGDALLRDDLGEEAFRLALAPLPTVTNHARRALFAGEIPGNSALDDTEADSANASGDRQAFRKNPSLKGIERTLLLKGDLGTRGDSAVDLLRRADAPPLVAAVFNGVDDALASHETTPLGPWSWSGIGSGALDVLRAAVESGWTVVVTADHGHTPYIDGARKVAPRAAGQRFHVEATAGSVTFEDGPLPQAPLHLLTDMGAWHGGQRQGFHGGAGIEEVVVPLAFLGRVEGEAGRPQPPDWWEGEGSPGALAPESVEVRAIEEARPAEPRISPAVQLAEGRSAALSVDVRTVLTGRARDIGALEWLAKHKVLTAEQMGRHVDLGSGLVSGMMNQILATLARASVELPFEVDDSEAVPVYRWKVRS